MNTVVEDKVDYDIEKVEPIDYLKWVPKDVEIEDTGWLIVYFIYFIN